MRILALLIFFLFGFSRPAFAAISVNVENVPNSINIDEEFTADVILTCTSCGTSYLRGVFFYPESSPVYSGYTQNNSGEWINLSGSHASSYFKVEEGSWSGQIKFKFDSAKATGDYFFKVGRYTAGGSSFAQDSEAKAIVVSGSSPTPTASSTPTATPTPSPTTAPTNSPTPTPTKTPASTPTPTKTPTTKPSPSPTSDIKRSDLLTPTASLASEILGASVSAVPSQEVVTPAVEARTIEKDFRQTDTFTAIAVGVTSLGLLGIIFYRLSKISIKERVK